MLAAVILWSCLPLSPMAAAEETEGLAFTLPSSLTVIEEEAFAGNGQIGKLVVPETVTEIGSRAFENCTGLTEVTITGRDITIADDAFDGCGKDVVFSAYSGSDAMVWAMTHGYVCEPLDNGGEQSNYFDRLVAHSGFSSSLLQSGAFASKCVIVRTNAGDRTLPDISAYNPVDIYQSDSNLYYVQFASEGDAEDCHNMLRGLGLEAEPDRIGANNDVFAQGVTIMENWGTNDTMGFDEYAPFVASHASGNVTIAVVDSGVNQSVWGGKISPQAASFVGGSATTDSARHGSKVASIINDCLGTNVSRVTLLPIKVVSSNSMYRTSVIIEGIKHAVKNNADIINLSLGWDVSEGTSPEIARQISNANAQGIHVVVAAGNGSGQVMFPANCSGAIAVSALTYSKANGYAVKSRTGSEIDFTAPGLHLSTSAYPNIDLAGDVTGSASTSFAAPQISAALALIEMDSTKGGGAVSVLRSCCMDLGAEGLSSSAYGSGLPRLDRLASIGIVDIELKNVDEGPVPSLLWLGDTGNNFLLTWEVVPANATEKTVTVTTSDASVVSLQKFSNTHTLVSAKGIGEAVISVTGGKVTKSLTIAVKQPVTEILITGAKDKLITGKTMQLAAAVLPENASDKEYAWKSSDETVASVSESGLVTAHKSGNVTITCEALDGYGTSAKAEIEVIDIPDAESIVLTAKEKEFVDMAVTLEVGEVLTLEAQVLPEEAIQEVYFNVFPKSILEHSGNGVVKAIAPGPASITATASTGKNVYEGISVMVVISPASVVVEAANTTLDIGDTTVVTGSILPENATDKTINWVSNNPDVATVNAANGVVTAIAPGTAEIVGVAGNGKKSSVMITVRQPITITFDAGEGLTAETTRTAFSGYEVGSLPDARRTYWQFNGWYTAQNGGVKVTAESVFTEDTTVYAQWVGLPYNVVFNAGEGECSTASMTGHVGTRLGSLPAAAMDAYAFKGWYTSLDDSAKEVTPEYVQLTTDELQLFAHWTAKPYTMMFNVNGGVCDTQSKIGTVDAAIGLLPVPTRAYYTFDGWFTSISGGNQITENYTQSTTTTVTVYAHWTPLPYTITFDANEGICDITEMNCVVDQEVGELPVPTRDYYTFNGWYTDSETPVYVTAAYRQETDADVTVVARWTANAYTITFEGNGGTCATKTMTGRVDQKIGEMPVPERSYYDFLGWYTSTSGGDQVTADTVRKTDAAFTLYAVWQPQKFTLTFDANGGTCSVASVTGTVDQKIGTLPVPERSYYTFTGWYTAAAGGTNITADYKHNTNQELVVYAQWTPGTYPITFNANGGVCSVTEMTGTVDQVIGTLPTPTRDYHTFAGWYTEGGTVLTGIEMKAETSPLVLTAHWDPLPYTMQFDANGAGATVSESAKQYKACTPVGTLATATRPYYDFDGWYTAATGGTKVTTAYAHASTDTIKVYAHWVPHTYTMYFNTNGGTCTTASKTGKVDTAIGTLPTPTRDYYNFNGWYTAASGGTKITTEWKQGTSASVTMYAQWTLKPESGWVLPANVPADAQVTSTSWSYRESTESTASTMSGWVANGSYWKQTGSGSKQYASFPSTYNTSHATYTELKGSAYSAYENATSKRTVTNTHAGYVYWHWAYNAAYANNTSRWISDRNQVAGSSRGLTDYSYKYFYAFKSTTNAPALSSDFSWTWGANAKYDSSKKTYNCANCLPSGANKSSTSGLNNPRFLRLDYYKSTYTDYTMYYKYYRDLSYQLSDPGTGSNITNKVEYVKYRLK